MLSQSCMPPAFWHHALQMATYILNHLPSKLLYYKSTTQILYQKTPSYSHLRVFRCLCTLFLSTTIKKLQHHSTPCAFLGYPSHHKGYKCYDILNRKIIIFRHVLFHEQEFSFAKIHSPSPTSYDYLCSGLHPTLLQHLRASTNVPSTIQYTPTIQFFCSYTFYYKYNISFLNTYFSNYK